MVDLKAVTEAPKPATVGEDLHPACMGAMVATVPGTGADLLFEILAAATKPEPDDGQPDERAEEIQAAVMEATPEVRTRAAQLATVLLPILARCRSVILACKSELQDADVSHGDAAVTPDGWLVVTMGGEQIGRVPFNPERGMEEAGRVAEDILAEHVRLHVIRPAEVVRIPMPDDAGETPPRPDGVRGSTARRSVTAVGL